MFRCERCGSRYSPVHASTLGSCPRCQIRDQVSAPLYFKPFRLAESKETVPPQDRPSQPAGAAIAPRL
jgi:predicted  nucleic acid-binding Zn-ribbon protein